jgi:hypothetical protein
MLLTEGNNMSKNKKIVVAAILASGFALVAHFTLSHAATVREAGNGSQALKIERNSTGFSSAFLTNGGIGGVVKKLTSGTVGWNDVGGWLTSDDSRIAGGDGYPAGGLSGGAPDSSADGAPENRAGMRSDERDRSAGASQDGRDSETAAYANLASGSSFLPSTGTGFNVGNFQSEPGLTAPGPAPSVSPVPESEMYAMLLAGLVLIGLLSQRRRVGKNARGDVARAGA